MMKAFESCLPEYQIMAVWIFIFLTLLYMILLICEGTGERQKKAMLQDSLLLIAAFLITSGLCVRREFYGEEGFMLVFRIPYGILIVMEICGFLFAGIQAFGIYKRRTNCLRENAIQESLDNLPSGIGVFDRNGMPKLMNRKMYQLCRNLAGRDIQNITELRKALSKNVVTLTREEETLSMKMRVHDNLGYSVLATQRMLMRESEEDRDMFLSQWKQTLDLLNKDNESVEGEQLHRQVQERAKILGVKIIYTGEKVWESHISELMDIILLEALSNCVRHAGASELYVKFSIEKQAWVMVLTDNGQKPEKNIKEGGGLSSIRKRVEQCGGSMRIAAAPRFSITVKLLREVRR